MPRRGERVAAGVGANLGAVLGDPLECDQTFRAEQAQHLRKQVIERLFMARAEIGQAVMIHWLQAHSQEKPGSCSHWRDISRALLTPLL